MRAIRKCKGFREGRVPTPNAANVLAEGVTPRPKARYHDPNA